MVAVISSPADDGRDFIVPKWWPCSHGPQMVILPISPRHRHRRQVLWAGAAWPDYSKPRPTGSRRRFRRCAWLRRSPHPPQMVILPILPRPRRRLHILWVGAISPEYSKLPWSPAFRRPFRWRETFRNSPQSHPIDGYTAYSGLAANCWRGAGPNALCELPFPTSVVNADAG